MISTLISRSSIILFLFATPAFANDIFLQMFGNSLEVDLSQSGSDNLIDITILDNNHRTVISQSGNNHSAILDLSGSYSNDIEVYQTNPSGNSFSLTQICTNPSGCAIVVIQE